LNVLREEVPTATPEDAKWFLGMVDTDHSETLSFGEYPLTQHLLLIS
jgi:hypothetical protein